MKFLSIYILSYRNKQIKNTNSPLRNKLTFQIAVTGNLIISSIFIIFFMLWI